MTRLSSTSSVPEPRRQLAFGMMVTAQLIFIVDALIASVAIPNIRTNLYATPV